MTEDELLKSPTFLEFIEEVRSQLESQVPGDAAAKAPLQDERQQLKDQCLGWRQSLSNPRLDESVRQVLEADFGAAQQRLRAIEDQLDQIERSGEQRTTAVDPRTIAQHFAELAAALGGENASATNVILSHHVDGIFCDRNGRVVIRTCRLGSLARVLGTPTTNDALPANGGEGDEEANAVQPRRRTRRDLGGTLADEEQAAIAIDFAVDPSRFDGLAPEWFTEDVYQVPEKKCWAEKHCLEVAHHRLQTAMTMQRTAEHFRRSIPTIRKALRIARDLHGLDALGDEVSRPTRANWARDHACEVASYFRQPGATMRGARERFGYSEKWIQTARRLGEQTGQSLPRL